jgi:hypothetical protein
MQFVLILIVLNYMIEAIAKAPSAFPFVILEDAVRDAPKYIRVAAIVNVSILVSLASAWLGVCIAAMVQTWQFLKYLRKRTSGLQRPASLGVQ